MNIGYARNGYQEQRNIIGLVHTCDYIFLHDMFSSVLRLRELAHLSWLLPSSAADAHFKFLDWDLNRVDLLHLYNGVSFGRLPWVVTFETILPRYRTALKLRRTDPDRVRRDRSIRRALDALASSSCKRLIAHSSNTAYLQHQFLSLFPDYEEEIEAKLETLRVPQQLPTSAVACRSISGAIRFLFVGGAFFCKGGREVLTVLDTLRTEKQLPIQLDIVSTLSPDAYATRTGPDDVLWAKDFIGSRGDWITYHGRIPNSKVHRLMEYCDVGLLPSYAETYGFSVLEFQSHMRPVITTDVRALPEINNDECGWIIEVPKHEHGEAIYNEPGGRIQVGRAIATGLTATVEDIFAHPECIASKGEKAYERVASLHDPTVIGTRLAEIYNEAIS